MGVSYRVDREHGIVHISATGVVNRDQFVRNQLRLMNDPAVTPGLPQLIDLRGVSRYALTGNNVREMASAGEIRPFHTRSSRLAIIAGSREGFGLARMYELSRDGPPDGLRVFDNEAEARAWLGLPPAD